MPPQPIRPGTRIGKYEILAHLATGGMSEVYQARDTILGRVVALKVLSADMASKPSALERFRREARHAARLSHRNVVTLWEFGEDRGTYFLALEYVEGIDLYEYIERQGRLEPEEARRILIQAVRALDHAFQHGIIHRDIKPSNFLLTAENDRLRVKLTDLGLARTATEDEFRVTRAGNTVGTIDYLSPEQARDSATADVRSDIYSLGCTFYHMLAGKPPFSEGGLGERVYKHLTVDPPDVREHNPDVPEEMWQVLRKMLAKDPEDRYQTPADLLADLKAVSGGFVNPLPSEFLQRRQADDDTTEEAPEQEWSASDGEGDPTPAPVARPKPSSDTSDPALRSGAHKPPTPAKPPSSPGSSTSQQLAYRDDPALLGIGQEQAEAAAAQFERARLAAINNNFEYALDLLFTCCRIDPLTLAYRQRLREVGRVVSRQKGGGGWLAGLKIKAAFKAAKRSEDVRRILDAGERVLVRNPRDMRTHQDMAEAAEKAGLRRLAAWLLDQASSENPGHVAVLQKLARLYESLGDLNNAIRVWAKITKASPYDTDANRRVQDLTAHLVLTRNRLQR
jgi:serine/threonine-protein kinase